MKHLLYAAVIALLILGTNAEGDENPDNTQEAKKNETILKPIWSIIDSIWQDESYSESANSSSKMNIKALVNATMQDVFNYDQADTKPFSFDNVKNYVEQYTQYDKDDKEDKDKDEKTKPPRPPKTPE